MTEIKDPEKTIKTVEKSNEWLKLLKKKLCLEKVFFDVDNNVIDCILQKCSGNTLYSL